MSQPKKKPVIKPFPISPASEPQQQASPAENKPQAEKSPPEEPPATNEEPYFKKESKPDSDDEFAWFDDAPPKQSSFLF